MIKSFLFIILLGQQPIDSVQFVDPAQVLEQAATLVEENELEKAIELYLTVSENDTSFVQVQSSLMSVYNAAEKYEECIEIGSKLKDQFSPYRKDIYIALGNAYLNGGNYRKAQEIYSEGLDLFPYGYILHYNLGLAHRNMDELDEAMICFQKSASINPFYANNHMMLGYLSMLQGHVAKSMLSYLTYLAIRPDNNNILLFLENLASESVRKEGSVEPFVDNDELKHYDELIRSRAALDPRFDHKVDFNASLVKQSELLLSKLRYDRESSDFWMQQYGPFFTQLAAQGLDEAFIYYILKSTGNEDVMRWIEKHDKERSAWIELANDALAQKRLSAERTLLGEKKVYSHWYFDSNNLNAVGDMPDDETKVGPWAFYYENGICSATGKYDQQGNKIGEWLYYHLNGRLSRREFYNQEGVISEPARYYHENGALSIVATYSDGGELDGTLEYYYACGQLKEKVPFINGTKSGEGQMYYETGQRKTNYFLEDGAMNGDYTHYFKNGKIDRKYKIENEVTDGLYQSFYINGQLEEEGYYVNDTLSGNWIGHYEGGELKYQGTMKDDNRTGRWEFFHKNGNLKEVIHYNDQGDKHGEHQYYTTQGRLHCIIYYGDPGIVGLKYLDPEGEILYEVHDVGGNMEYKTYYETGEQLALGTLKDGKLNGMLETYFKNGNLKQQVNTINDYYDGPFTEYYSNGELFIQCNYQEGEKQGRYLQFHENGAVRHDGWYVDDQAEQAWNTYHPDGSLDEYNYYIGEQNHGWNHYYAPGNKLHRSYRYDMDLLVELRQYDTLGQIYHKLDIEHGNGIQVRKTVAGDTVFVAPMQCGQFVGDVKSFYGNGVLEAHDRIVNGLYEGAYKALNADGSIVLEGAYKDNLQDGSWKWYHYNGNTRTDHPYVRGEIDGESSRYYVHGKLESKCIYSEGDRDGACIYYDQKGNHQLTRIYSKSDGFVAYVDVKSKDTIQFNPKGEFKLESFFENGQLAVMQSFQDGKIHGEGLWHNIDGSITERQHFEKGYSHGKRVKYYPNGNVFVETPMQFDNKHGVEMEYYENGKIRRRTPFVNDNINGFEIIYDRDGSIKSKIYYRNDEEY